METAELSLPANSVDVVCCCQALERLEDKRGTIAAAYRALKPGGRLIFVEPIDNLDTLESADFRSYFQI